MAFTRNTGSLILQLMSRSLSRTLQLPWLRINYSTHVIALIDESKAEQYFLGFQSNRGPDYRGCVPHMNRMAFCCSSDSRYTDIQSPFAQQTNSGQMRKGTGALLLMAKSHQ